MTPNKKFYTRPSLMAAIITLLTALIAVPTSIAMTKRPGQPGNRFEGEVGSGVKVEAGEDTVRSVAGEETGKCDGQGQMSLRLLIPKERIEGLELVMFDRERKKFVEAFAKGGPAMPGFDDNSCRWYG